MPVIKRETHHFRTQNQNIKDKGKPTGDGAGRGTSSSFPFCSRLPATRLGCNDGRGASELLVFPGSGTPAFDARVFFRPSINRAKRMFGGKSSTFVVTRRRHSGHVNSCDEKAKRECHIKPRPTAKRTKRRKTRHDRTTLTLWDSTISSKQRLQNVCWHGRTFEVPSIVSRHTEHSKNSDKTESIANEKPGPLHPTCGTKKKQKRHQGRKFEKGFNLKEFKFEKFKLEHGFGSKK